MCRFSEKKLKPAIISSIKTVKRLSRIFIKISKYNFYVFYLFNMTLLYIAKVFRRQKKFPSVKRNCLRICQPFSALVNQVKLCLTKIYDLRGVALSSIITFVWVRR